MLSLDSGSIEIDGVNIATLQQRHLRSKIINVPQEPFITPGSIRDGVDPWKLKTDIELITILRSISLWESVEEKGGLQAEASTLSFSTGQLQLLSLARVLIQQGKIIVMDEVTSK